MSVDLEATLRQPVTLAAVLDQARMILTDLLGITPRCPTSLSSLTVSTSGACASHADGALDTAELAATVIGDPIVPDENGQSGAVFFEIDVPVTGDGVRLMVIDSNWGGADEGRHAVFSPYRTCVGVTLATCLALAVAELAGGEYLDEQIWMLTPPVREPDQVINRTRLSEAASDFAAQCEKYLRQFPDLGGWPQDPSMR